MKGDEVQKRLQKFKEDMDRAWALTIDDIDGYYDEETLKRDFNDDKELAFDCYQANLFDGIFVQAYKDLGWSLEDLEEWYNKNW